jgi:hypothetical protein
LGLALAPQEEDDDEPMMTGPMVTELPAGLRLPRDASISKALRRPGTGAEVGVAAGRDPELDAGDGVA